MAKRLLEAQLEAKTFHSDKENSMKKKLALLLALALVFTNLSIPANVTDKGPWLTDGGHRTAISMR